MTSSRKYPDELRERATRLVLEARRDPERSKGAIARIAGDLGVHPEALRTWVKRSEIDGGLRAGTTSGMPSGSGNRRWRTGSCGAPTRS